MKHQAFFSSKDKRIKRRLLQILYGALRVKANEYTSLSYCYFFLKNSSVLVLPSL